MKIKNAHYSPSSLEKTVASEKEIPQIGEQLESPGFLRKGKTGPHFGGNTTGGIGFGKRFGKGGKSARRPEQSGPGEVVSTRSELFKIAVMTTDASLFGGGARKALCGQCSEFSGSKQPREPTGEKRGKCRRRRVDPSRRKKLNPRASGPSKEENETDNSGKRAMRIHEQSHRVQEAV